MGEDKNVGAFEEPLIIRYDGMDAKRHELELSSLAESIKGFSRIISVAANFAATEKFVKHKDAMDVKLLASAPKAACFEIPIVIAWVSQNAIASTVVGGLTVTLVSYIFKRLAKDKAEMKELRGALETAIRELGNRDQAVVDRLLTTIDNMADSLKPAAKQALSPIGKSASTVSVTSNSTVQKARIIGIAERDAIEAKDPPEYTEETVFKIKLHEMNKDHDTCKVSFEDEPDARVVAAITDPVINSTNNVYVTAFAADSFISVRAKAAIRDGVIEKLYISDTA